MINNKYITDYLKDNATKIGSQAALVCADRTLDWSSLLVEAEVIARFISNQVDFNRKEIVAIFLPNSWQFVASYYGIIMTNHLAMPIDIGYKKLELDNIVAHTQPTIIITDADHLSLFSESKNVFSIDEILNKKQYHLIKNFESLSPEKEISTLFYSSGTTGKPKAIPNTHYNQLWDVEAITKPMGWTSQDTLLLSLPLSHRHGLVIGLLGALYHGNALNLHQHFDAEKTLSTLSSGKISIYLGVPAIYQKLIDHSFGKSYDFSQVRLFESGSSHLPHFLWEAFKKTFNSEIFDRYGTSETGTMALDSLSNKTPGHFSHKPKGVQTRIEQDGELVIKSPGLFPGYYKNKAATKANFTDDGWWRTGDLFVTENTCLVLKSRIQEKIIKNGYYVNPRDIEWALRKNKKIKDIYVLGLQDDQSINDSVIYFIVGAITQDEIERYCKESLPSFWRPDKIILLKAIPKTSTGKPILPALKEIIKRA